MRGAGNVLLLYERVGSQDGGEIHELRSSVAKKDGDVDTACAVKCVNPFDRLSSLASMFCEAWVGEGYLP